MIRDHVARGRGCTLAESEAQRATLDGDEARGKRWLCDVCAWLVTNSMRSEQVQFNLLCEQSLGNIWRKARPNETASWFLRRPLLTATVLAW